MASRGCIICGMTRERAQECGIRILFHSPKTGHQNKVWENVVRRRENLVPSLILVCSRHFYQGFPGQSTKSNDYEPKNELVRKEAPMNYYERQTQRLWSVSDSFVPVLIKSETIAALDVRLCCKLCLTLCSSKLKLNLHRIAKHAAKCPECIRRFVVTEQSQKSKICGACECKRRKPLPVIHHTRKSAPQTVDVCNSHPLYSSIYATPDVFIPQNIDQTRKLFPKYTCEHCKKDFCSLREHNLHRVICRNCHEVYCASKRGNLKLSQNYCSNCNYPCLECKRRFYSKSELKRHKVFCKECKRFFCTLRGLNKQAGICLYCKYKLYFVPSNTPAKDLAPKVTPQTTERIVAQNLNFKCGNCKAKFDTATAFELHLKFCIDQSALDMMHPDREPIYPKRISIGEMKEDEKNVLSEFDIFKNSEKVGYFGLDLLDEKQMKTETDFI